MALFVPRPTWTSSQPQTCLFSISRLRSEVSGVPSRSIPISMQMKHGLFEYSFYPMRHEGMSDDNYISGSCIHAYLNDFAWDFDLTRRIRLQTTVTNVSRIPGRGWRLGIAGKPVIECEK